MKNMLISLVVSFLFISFLGLESYAGKGFFSCCCDDDEIADDTPLLYTCSKEERVSDFALFKKCVVADGDCDMNIISSFLIKETITSGRGNKRIIFNSQAGKSPDDKVLDFSGRQVTFFANSVVLNEGTDATQRIFNPLTHAGGYSFSEKY